MTALRYQACDVVDFDEAGLLFRAESRNTLATGPVEGTKVSKERITAALCANATGTEKLRPFVIGKVSVLRSAVFGGKISTLSINKNAWMTQKLFQSERQPAEYKGAL